MIDDDPSHIRLLEILADDLEVQVHAATSCKEALEALNEASFDMILMDWRMPETDGCECTRLMRTNQTLATPSTVPIIGVSAYGSVEQAQLCLASGMDDFISKPFTLECLRQKLLQWQNKKSNMPPDTVSILKRS